MARMSVSVKLERPDDSRAEAATIKAGNTWISPEGGWMSAQSGIWNESPLGIHLMDAANQVHVADCLGLHYDNAAVGNSGRSEYPSIGATGTWSVFDTNDS